MSNLFSGISGRFRGTQSKAPQSKTASPSPSTGQGPSAIPTLNTSASSGNLAPRISPVPASPSLSSTMALGSAAPADPNDPLARYNLPMPRPLWLNENYAKQIVRGNFMTLSTKPKTLEQGEWIAHQVVEHFRILWLFVRVINEKDEDGSQICNQKTCPKMSAGIQSFTWLNQRREPVELPAHEYITLMQRWIAGKIENHSLFPVDPAGVSASPYANSAPAANAGAPGSEWVGKASGFPQEFLDVCQAMFRQMFRVYAHLYWAHYREPFYELSLEKQLNSCFSHFVLTAMELNMMKPSELEPMQPLIDLWAANGTFPPESKAYANANLEAGRKLLQLAEQSG